MKAANIDQDSKIAQGIGRATAGAHHKIDQAVEASGPAVDRAAHGAHATVDAVGGFAKDTAGAIDEKSEQISAATSKFAKATSEYLTEHPFTSLGIAVAAGFLISRFMSR